MSNAHDALVSVIASFAKQPNMSFDDKSQSLISYIKGLGDSDLRTLTAEAGFIPEEYSHDSSEEKVYAKAMDILVADCLSRVGYTTAVSTERSNSADVVARCQSEQGHTLVLDAKAFRLSRTALNPKDYKIEALNTWRKGADFACLVGPLTHFPQESRLFEEVIKFNVTLLTFSHLQFMLEHGLPSCDSLSTVWDIAKDIKDSEGESPTATQYWKHVDQAFCTAIHASIDDWKSARRAYYSAMVESANKQIQYFEGEKARIASLSHEELTKLALNALKLDNKIDVIQEKKRKTLALLTQVENAER